MIPAIDGYSFHRYFGHHYPDLEEPSKHFLTPKETINFASGLGVGGIAFESCFFDEITPFLLASLKEKAEQHNLETVWAWGHPNGLYSGLKPEALDDMIQHMDYAKDIGANVMRICCGGRKTRPQNWAEHKNSLLPLLNEAVRHAEEHELVLAIENHIDLYADELVELIETINSPHLGICLDTANNLRMFEDPNVAIAKMAPYTKTTHIKDIRAYKGDPKTFAFWPSVPIGEGLIDFPFVISELEKYNYQGLLAIEIDYLHPDYANEFEALKLSVRNLKKLLKQGKKECQIKVTG